jgi:hypothetical protein
MQAAMIEPVAVPVTGSGLSCDDLANKIKVSVSKGDQYHQTALKPSGDSLSSV